MKDTDQKGGRGPAEAIESSQLIHRVDIEGLFQVESPSEWEINLHLCDEGIYRRKFSELDLRPMTLEDRRVLLGERQGLLLKLPCSRAALVNFIRREGLRYRIDRDYLSELNKRRRCDRHRDADPVPAQRPAETTVPKPVPDRGRIVKRCLLIGDNMRRWPTIEQDLKDSGKNGLTKAARVLDQHGLWYEGSALAWARAKGKVREVPSELAGLPGRIHRLD